MRAILALELASVLVFQPIVATAREPSLQERLRDVSAEAERFAAGLSEADLNSALRSDEAGVEQARLRARLRRLPSRAEVSVVLRGGEGVEGELAEAGSEEFELWVRAESGGSWVKKHFRYDEIQSSVLPKSDGWMPIDRISGIERGKKVEVLLVDETTFKGRFSSMSPRVLTLDLGEEKIREVPIDEVASIRTRGMDMVTKSVIIAGSIVGGLFLISYIMLATNPG